MVTLSEHNKCISDYLDYYLELKKPYFAVLIDGDWGCGKTWLIKTIMEEKYESDQYIYVSLYGLKSTSDIDMGIFAQLYPLLTSKPFSIVSNIVKGAIKTGFNIDIDSNLNFNEFLKDYGKKIPPRIVFDDLERSSIPIQELFGYINNFVEHKGLNVILLANTINSILSESEDVIKRTKEKIIGASFTVEAEFQLAFKSFINELPTTQKELYTTNLCDIIEKVFSTLKYNNLRALRQSILAYNYFINLFPGNFISILKERFQKYFFYKSRRSDFLAIAEAFFYYSFEKSAGYLIEKDYPKGLSLFRILHISYKDFFSKDTEEKQKIETEQKYFLGFNDNLLDGHWVEIMRNNSNVKKLINELYNDILKEINNQTKPIWQFINGFPNQKKERVKEIYSLLLNDIKESKYLEAGEILHSAGILLYLSDNVMIQKSKNNIVKLYKTYINKNCSKIYGIYDGLRDHFGGHSFFCTDTHEFQDIFNHLLNNEHHYLYETDTKEINNEIQSLPTNISAFSRELIHINYSGKYSSTPALSFIKNPLKFYKKLSTFKRDDILTLLQALNERYEIKYSNGKVKEEYKHEKVFIFKMYTYFEKLKKRTSKLYNLEHVKYKLIIEYLEKIKLLFDNL